MSSISWGLKTGPGCVQQYVFNTWCRRSTIGILASIVRSATVIVNTGVAGGGRNEQKDPSQSHRDTPDST